jgi:hypothetical protein
MGPRQGGEVGAGEMLKGITSKFGILSFQNWLPTYSNA